MKAIVITPLLFCALVFACCRQTSIREVPVEKPATILKDLKSFLAYSHDHLKLSEEFIGYNVDSKVLNKEEFLTLVSSGRYLPVRLHSKTDSMRYKLYELDPFSNKDIQSTLGYLGSLHYVRYKMEGKRLPEFNFTDINGNLYNSETTAGKIIVMNVWFIACGPCRAEMPSLNHLVERYKNRDDVLFLSLAPDSKKDLQDFLTGTIFKYAVVSDQRPYIEKALRISQYPTQILINKQGLVVKVVDDDRAITALLDKESSR